MLTMNPDMEFQTFMVVLIFLFIIAVTAIFAILFKYYSDTKKAANSWGYYTRFSREQRRIRDKKKGRY